MNEPDRFSSGEILSAQKLNEVLDYARPSYAGVPSHGSSIFGSQSANGSVGPQFESVILVYATEDFVNQTTDAGVVDDVPSGLCDFVRLTQSTNTHQNSSGRAFYVHDVLAELANGTPKANNDVFYAVWNHDSKRWEVLGADPGAKRMMFTVAEVNCVDDYNDELNVLVEWTHYTGGCGGPPGVDYDGYITVYDSCILSYFTAEDLVGKVGSATYWTVRSDCSKRWIVDNICGEPVCG